MNAAKTNRKTAPSATDGRGMSQNPPKTPRKHSEDVGCTDDTPVSSNAAKGRIRTSREIERIINRLVAATDGLNTALVELGNAALAFDGIGADCPGLTDELASKAAEADARTVRLLSDAGQLCSVLLCKAIFGKPARAVILPRYELVKAQLLVDGLVDAHGVGTAMLGEWVKNHIKGNGN